MKKITFFLKTFFSLLNTWFQNRFNTKYFLVVYEGQLRNGNIRHCNLTIKVTNACYFNRKTFMSSDELKNFSSVFIFNVIEMTPKQFKIFSKNNN